MNMCGNTLRARLVGGVNLLPAEHVERVQPRRDDERPARAERLVERGIERHQRVYLVPFHSDTLILKTFLSRRVGVGRARPRWDAAQRSHNSVTRLRTRDFSSYFSRLEDG